MTSRVYLFQEKNPKLFKSNNYEFSEHLENFEENSSKITTLLILSKKIEEMAFKIDDTNFFQEMAGVWYSGADSTIPDMKK